MMKELKKHISIDDQVKLLKSRGLIIDDTLEAKNTLSSVSYYRLSGYLHDFKINHTDSYIEGLTWHRLKRIYEFDRKLNRLLMYVLEDVEQTFKTRLSYTLTSAFPDIPLVYLSPEIYRNRADFDKFKGIFKKTRRENKNLPFVKHHYDNYGGQLPMWVAVELFTMGNLQSIYKNLHTPHQKSIARIYNTGVNQLSNWLENLTHIRNHLAHNMRIYNFDFGKTPANCKKHNRTFTPTQMIFDYVYVMACIYSDKHDWNSYVIPELCALFYEYDDAIVLADIGFPENWEEILTQK